MDCCSQYTNLPKWPRIVVSGTNITHKQATEIIFRTADLEFICNDHVWRRKLHNELNTLVDKDESGVIADTWFFVDYDKLAKVEKELGILNIKYLRNCQIATSYIGGPYGWCSWDGVIGCDGYNIGKWPSVKSIYKEWVLIAKTWPFLNLKCQLWNTEFINQDNCIKPLPIVEFTVANGTVLISEPKSILTHSNITPRINPKFGKFGAERGCTLETFKNSLFLLKENNQ